jgi:hypothetical protein
VEGAALVVQSLNCSLLKAQPLPLTIAATRNQLKKRSEQFLMLADLPQFIKGQMTFPQRMWR